MSNEKPELTLPALRSLGALADTRPILIRDTREQRPLEFQRLRCVVGTLTTGDYSILGLTGDFAIERKSIDDLVGCCTLDRPRFERELLRLRAYKFRRLLIIGSRGLIETGRFHSRVAPSAVLGSLATWEIRFDCPLVYANSPAEAAAMVESWAFRYAREYVRTCNELLRAAQNDPGEGEGE